MESAFGGRWTHDQCTPCHDIHEHLIDLEVKSSDIQNAYLTAPCEEKIWTTHGPEFGQEQGKMAM